MIQHVRIESWIPTRNMTGISPPVKKSPRYPILRSGAHQASTYSQPCRKVHRWAHLPQLKTMDKFPQTHKKRGGSILFLHFFLYIFFIWAIAIKLTQSKMKFFMRWISFYYDPRIPEIGIQKFCLPFSLWRTIGRFIPKKSTGIFLWRSQGLDSV